MTIPTYQRHRLLETSLRSAAAQEGPADYEIIVVDNDPSPESRERAEAIIGKLVPARIEYVQNPSNHGMVGNWNRCIALSRGAYLTILSDDDILDKNYVRVMSDIISGAHPDLVKPWNRVIGPEDPGIRNTENPGEIFLERVLPVDMLMRNRIGTPVGTLIRREALTGRGLAFRESAYPSFDYALWAEMAASGLLVFIAHVELCSYRIAVNQSLERKTVVGFLAQDRKVRTMIGAAMHLPRSLVRLWNAIANGYSISMAPAIYRCDVAGMFRISSAWVSWSRRLYLLISKAVFRLARSHKTRRKMMRLVRASAPSMR